MNNDRQNGARNVSAGGMAGEHPSVDPFQFVVGPTTTDQFNTAHLRLIPIACWRVDDIRFAFDSSFVTSESSSDSADPPNDIRAELAHLLDLVKSHPECPLSVFGHADPVGNDDYNKALSGRRAMAVYALLIVNSNPNSAVSLWQQISATEHWGIEQRQTMQALSGLPSGTADAVLFRSYMQKLCPSELNLSRKDFLAQGADSEYKGDVQGCSEFNPLLIFSAEKQAKFDTAARQNNSALLEDRNAQNAPNRRVLVLMFRKGSRIDPGKWPCPRVHEGVGGCVKRFWSDGEKRRSTHLSGIDRTFEKMKDTFACRFFDRLTRMSPCETATGFFRIRLHNYRGRKMPAVPYQLTYGGRQETGKTDVEGFVNVAASPLAERLRIVWEPLNDNPRGPEDFNYQMDVFANPADLDSTDGLNQRLHNLGYPIEIQDLALKVRAFQAQHTLDITGQVDDATKAKLQEIYGRALDEHIDISQDNPSAGPEEKRT